MCPHLKKVAPLGDFLILQCDFPGLSSFVLLLFFDLSRRAKRRFLRGSGTTTGTLPSKIKIPGMRNPLVYLSSVLPIRRALAGGGGSYQEQKSSPKRSCWAGCPTDVPMDIWADVPGLNLFPHHSERRFRARASLTEGMGFQDIRGPQRKFSSEAAL